uniref:Uncharacterized protein n=1 Tax=Romanomermis culicivorax TaxID=13658 RepID=A0A915KZ59_ROMCU
MKSTVFTSFSCRRVSSPGCTILCKGIPSANFRPESSAGQLDRSLKHASSVRIEEEEEGEERVELY